MGPGALAAAAAEVQATEVQATEVQATEAEVDAEDAAGDTEFRCPLTSLTFR
jgi:hypothetical protein